MRNLGRVSLGFEPDGLVAFELVLPRRVVSEAASPEARRAEQQRVAELRRADQARLMEALRRTPGVTGAAATNQVTADSGCGGTAIYLEGQPPDAPGQRVCVTEVTSDFFSTLRMSLRSGRFLSESDQGREPLAVMINETAARTYWPGRNPIGALVRLSQPDNDLMEVVGVAGDTRNSGVSRPAVPEVYVSAAGQALNQMNVVVRSDLPADQVIAAVRRSIRQTEATAALNDVRTVNDAFGRTMLLERLSSLVMTFFGLAALLMATLGIYGVVSYFVRQRTVELGTRMALGAVNRDLVALVLGGGLKLSLAGVAVGSIALVGGVWLLVRYLEVANFGWLPFAASTAVVALVAAAAASVPAWRTTLISPMVAMREQPPSVWRWARQRMAARRSRRARGGRRRGRQRIGRLAGRRADGVRRRRARRRLVQRRPARRARQRVRGAARRIGRTARAARRLDDGVPLPRRRRRARSGRTGRGRRRIPDHAAARLSAAAAVCAE